MQNYNKFNDSDYISDAPDKLNNNLQSIAFTSSISRNHDV